MPYRPIVNGAPEFAKVSKIVHRIEGYYLRPVHFLLRLPTPEFDDPCMFVIAQVLLAAISGVSTTLYNEKTQDGTNFVGVMVEYYPWELEPDAQIEAEQAAEQLYKHFRNPLTHHAGANVQYQPGREPKVLGNKVGLTEQQIASLEDANVFKPKLPTFTIRADTTPVLMLTNLYWGTRILVERLTADRPRMERAEASLPDHV